MLPSLNAKMCLFSSFSSSLTPILLACRFYSPLCKDLTTCWICFMWVYVFLTWMICNAKPSRYSCCNQHPHWSLPCCTHCSWSLTHLWIQALEKMKSSMVSSTVINPAKFCSFAVLSTAVLCRISSMDTFFVSFTKQQWEILSSGTF